jgi:magnesium chelatase subunit D
MSPAHVSDQTHSDTLSIDAEILRWQLACKALILLNNDPHRLRGLLVSCSHGPVHQAFLTQLAQQFTIAHIPVSVSADRLNGGIDINQTLIAGKRVFQPGLLQIDREALLINGAERLPTTTSAILSHFLENSTADSPVLVAMDESTDDEAGLAETALGERLGLMLTLPQLPLSELQNLLNDEEILFRTEAVAGTRQSDMWSSKQPSEINTDAIGKIELPERILQELAMFSLQIGIDSLRPLLYATRVARGHAALNGRDTVSAEDAAIAVQLVLAPRARIRPEPAAPDESQDQLTEPEDNQPAPPPEDLEPQSSSDQTGDEDDQPAEPDQQELSEQLLDAAHATLPAHLIASLVRSQKQTSGVGRDAKSAAKGRSGRPTGVRRPRGGLSGQRLNLIETLKSAVPKQKLRQKTTRTGARLQIRAEDFRITQFKQPSRTTTVFVVDASGSAALHRLAEAKGAVELLLAECYVRRDRVAMISFRGQQARLELPPTRSLVRAKRELAGLPGGGGTPLAAALDMSLSLVIQLKQAGETPVVVIMSDGKANVTRDARPSRAEAMDQAHAAARSLAASDIKCLFIDTAPRPRHQAAELASSMRATYLPLPQGGARQLHSVLAVT